MNEEKNRELMYMFRNGDRKNLSEWVEHIVDNFCEEQAINNIASFDSIKDHFHESFLCTVPTLFFKVLIDKGVAHIAEPRPPLIEPRSDNDKKEISRWKKFVEEQEWRKFVN